MTNIEKLVTELQTRQQTDGIQNVRFFRASERTSMDRLAKGALDLLQAETVRDDELF